MPCYVIHAQLMFIICVYFSHLDIQNINAVWQKFGFGFRRMNPHLIRVFPYPGESVPLLTQIREGLLYNIYIKDMTNSVTSHSHGNLMDSACLQPNLTSQAGGLPDLSMLIIYLAVGIAVWLWVDHSHLHGLTTHYTDAQFLEDFGYVSLPYNGNM